jgi:hypothetical protein
MEEDIYEYEFKSDLLQKPAIQRQLESLAAAAEKAGEIIKYESAHNPEIQYAIDIVGAFLRKKGRVCYGGTAINAILPKNLRFYDPQKDLPDYDFFTPNPEQDIKDIVKDLQEAGFSDVVERVGIHDGTHKILVNFMPIADISTLEPELYRVLYKRSIEKEGIHYSDPDFLRMMMYLELSRPRGQVERWGKVFERLTLLNAAFPPKVCRTKTEDLVGHITIPLTIRKTLLDYVIENKRVLMGAEVISMYDWLLSKTRKLHPTIHWFLKKNGMIVFVSPEAERDAKRLKEIFSSDKITKTVHEGKGELVPQRIVLSYDKMPFVEILQETACHSFTSLSLPGGKKLLVASLETMITFYYALMMFTEDEKILQFYMSCLCQKLVEMSIVLHRKGGVGPIPSFSIECTGYQKGYATLLKEKFERIAKEKAKQKRGTLKRKSTQKQETIKRKSAEKHKTRKLYTLI